MPRMRKSPKSSRSSRHAERSHQALESSTDFKPVENLFNRKEPLRCARCGIRYHVMIIFDDESRVCPRCTERDLLGAKMPEQALKTCSYERARTHGWTDYPFLESPVKPEPHPGCHEAPSIASVGGLAPTALEVLPL